MATRRSQTTVRADSSEEEPESLSSTVQNKNRRRQAGRSDGVSEHNVVQGTRTRRSSAKKAETEGDTQAAMQKKMDALKNELEKYKRAARLGQKNGNRAADEPLGSGPEEEEEHTSYVSRFTSKGVVGTQPEAARLPRVGDPRPPQTQPVGGSNAAPHESSPAERRASRSSSRSSSRPRSRSSSPGEHSRTRPESRMSVASQESRASLPPASDTSAVDTDFFDIDHEDDDMPGNEPRSSPATTSIRGRSRADSFNADSIQYASTNGQRTRTTVSESQSASTSLGRSAAASSGRKRSLPSDPGPSADGRHAARTQDHTGSAHARKRARSRSASPPAPVEAVKFRGGRTEPPEGPPKASDYDKPIEDLINLAVRRYTVKLYTCNAFPYSDQSNEWAMESWLTQCKAAGRRFRPEDNARIIAAIVRRTSSIRSHIRDKSKPFVAAQFKLDADTTKSTVVTANAARVTSLMSGKPRRFSYKDWEEAHPELYAEDKTLMQILQSELFKNDRDIGVEFSKEFDPMPLPVLALLLTSVEFTLDSWSSGAFDAERSFRAAEYREKYNFHCDHLKQWAEDCGPQLVVKLRSKMFARVLKLGGIAIKSRDAHKMSDDARERIAARLSRRTGDTDSE